MECGNLYTLSIKENKAWDMKRNTARSKQCQTPAGGSINTGQRLKRRADSSFCPILKHNSAALKRTLNNIFTRKAVLIDKLVSCAYI